MKGVLIPEITVEELRSASLEGVEQLMTEGTMRDVEIHDWILCSERMPEEKDSMFAKVYGTDRWRNGMFRKRSEYVDVTVVRSDGEREVAVAKTLDGKWNIEQDYYLHPVKVIAWKPKVEPYMGDEK